MDTIKREMKQYFSSLFIIYRYLSSVSENYPLVGYRAMKDWCKAMNLFDGRFNLIILTDLF